MARTVTIFAEVLLAGILVVFLLAFWQHVHINSTSGVMDALSVLGEQELIKDKLIGVDERITDAQEKNMEILDIAYVGGVLDVNKAYGIDALFSESEIEILQLPADAVFDEQTQQICFAHQGMKKIRICYKNRYDLYFTIPVAYVE